MKSSEANKIIAEYMGYTVYPNDAEFIPQGMMHVKEYSLAYSQSLDALVPVWEKLNLICDFDICRSLDDKWRFCLKNFTGSIVFSYESNSVQEAAAIATAKAILEIRE